MILFLLGDWLIGSHQDGGAHKKYRPGDMNFGDCKRMLYECHQMQLQQQQQASSRSGNRSRESTASKKRLNKLETYELICTKFKPVFRHFFTETFAEPREWHRARVAYTTSCATASIVGYVVGLGDRHVQNILVDTQTAELVHIDLGIAFEQGRILPIPETVPFRLTRDIVDGFGVCGMHGLFRSSCELTLDLLKLSKEFVLTIFEVGLSGTNAKNYHVNYKFRFSKQVLLYDPLHNWTLSPSKAYALQQASEISTGLSTPMPQTLSSSDSPVLATSSTKQGDQKLK